MAKKANNTDSEPVLQEPVLKVNPLTTPFSNGELEVFRAKLNEVIKCLNS